MMKAVPLYADQDLKGVVEIVSTIEAESLSTGAIISLIGIGFIIFLMIIGFIIQMTNIGNKPGVENPSEKPEEIKQKWALFFCAFNPIMNLQKLFHVKEGGDQTLAAFHGVRVLSIGWVVLGHAYGLPFVGPITNVATALNMSKTPIFSLVPGGYFAVDTFFYLSGFLTFGIMTQKLYSKGGWVGPKNTLLIYFHRYYRLIFPIIFVTIIALFLLRYMGSGPIFKQSMVFLEEPCRRNWWPNLLFINNFYPVSMGDQCIPWVWYLPNDFQFFLISPFIILAYCKKRIVGYILIISLILISAITSAIMSYTYDIGVNMDSTKIDGMSWLYQKPWSRLSPYFIGAFFGLTYFEFSCQNKYPELKNSIVTRTYENFRKSRLLSVFTAAIGIGLTALYVFPTYDYYSNCPLNGPSPGGDK